MVRGGVCFCVCLVVGCGLDSACNLMEFAFLLYWFIGVLSNVNSRRVDRVIQQIYFIHITCLDTASG